MPQNSFAMLLLPTHLVEATVEAFEHVVQETVILIEPTGWQQ